MHIDARELENGSVIEGDVCIVGAGAAGLGMALDWLGYSRKVILLEGGGFDYDEQVQDLFGGKVTGQRYYPLKSCRLHKFGGTTGHWAGFCSVLDPIDFEKRSYVPHSGWPISRKDLDPFYEKAQRTLALREFNYDSDYWQKKLNAAALPFDERVVLSKIWQFSGFGPVSGPGWRDFGATHKDTVTGAPNIHLYTYAHVVNIKANNDVSSIAEVTVANQAGKRHTVRARHFVLACCSIQNARLLLASNTQTSKGLGNDHDLVGRYFMDHLEIASGELWLKKPDLLPFYGMAFNGNPRAELAVSAVKQQEHRMLNCTASLMPAELAKNFPVAIKEWSKESPIESGEQFVGKIGKAMSDADAAKATDGYQSFQLVTRSEQAPDPGSRVTLDTEKDALGMPRAQLHWQLNELDKHSIRSLYELIGTEAGRTGIGRVRLMEYLRDPRDDSWPDFTGGGWHHMGTTRMSDNPKLGVVDANCKVHGIANLYLAGASCFATSGAVNPTLSLVALSLRLSDHLKRKV